jgi:hypothetical protein
MVLSVSMEARPQHFYLDTNAFRYFGMAFAEHSLASDLRERMLISPLNAFEVLAQLAREDWGDVLRQINAIQNWTNPRCGLLPWPDGVFYQVWHGKPKPDDDFVKRMEFAFNWCMEVHSPASLKKLKDVAAEHDRLMDDLKRQKAEEFKDMIDAAKQEKLKAFDMTEAWFGAIANRVGGDSKSKPVAEIVSALSAYHEFEEAKLHTALANPKYNPLSKKNRNDIIDVEQLVYLFDESLCMVTADKGFKSKVTKSKQAARIITAPAIELMDAKKVDAILRAALR